MYGRLYNGNVLDTIELGVEQYTGLSAFKVVMVISYDVSLLLQTAKCIVGSKPCLVFSGDLFETDSEYARLTNLLIS